MISCIPVSAKSAPGKSSWRPKRPPRYWFRLQGINKSNCSTWYTKWIKVIYKEWDHMDHMDHMGWWHDCSNSLSHRVERSKPIFQLRHQWALLQTDPVKPVNDLSDDGFKAAAQIGRGSHTQLLDQRWGTQSGQWDRLKVEVEITQNSKVNVARNNSRCWTFFWGEEIGGALLDCRALGFGTQLFGTAPENRCCWKHFLTKDIC